MLLVTWFAFASSRFKGPPPIVSRPKYALQKEFASSQGPKEVFASNRIGLRAKIRSWMRDLGAAAPALRKLIGWLAAWRHLPMLVLSALMPAFRKLIGWLGAWRRLPAPVFGAFALIAVPIIIALAI